jgi:hypothetical protein
MTALTTSHGIYLVGWFGPDAWDTKDRRRARAINLAKNPHYIEQQLEQQQAELASEGVMALPVVLDVSLK